MVPGVRLPASPGPGAWNKCSGRKVPSTLTLGKKPPHPQVFRTLAIFCPQIAYRDRLKDIRATLEVSPFFKCHEVNTGLSFSGLWRQPLGLPT